MLSVIFKIVKFIFWCVFVGVSLTLIIAYIDQSNVNKRRANYPDDVQFIESEMKELSVCTGKSPSDLSETQACDNALSSIKIYPGDAAAPGPVAPGSYSVDGKYLRSQLIRILDNKNALSKKYYGAMNKIKGCEGMNDFITALCLGQNPSTLASDLEELEHGIEISKNQEKDILVRVTNLYKKNYE